MHLPVKKQQKIITTPLVFTHMPIVFLQMKSLLLQPIGLKIQLHTTGKLMQCRTQVLLSHWLALSLERKKCIGLPKLNTQVGPKTPWSPSPLVPHVPSSTGSPVYWPSKLNTEYILRIDQSYFEQKLPEFKRLQKLSKCPSPKHSKLRPKNAPKNPSPFPKKWSKALEALLFAAS